MSTITFYSVFGYDLKSMVLRVSIPIRRKPMSKNGKVFLLV